MFLNKNYSFVKQFDAMDCGPACLSMVAKTYKKDYSLEYLREKTFLTKEGVSLLGISDAAESIGIKTVGGKITFDQLVHEANLPCILHWDQKHFVVLFEVVKSIRKIPKKLIVGDPAQGIINYSPNEFKEHWISSVEDGEENGIVLLLTPESSFYQKNSTNTSKTSLSSLFGYFRTYKKYFRQIFIGLLIGSLVSLIFPFLTQSIIDIGIADKNIDFIYLVLIAQLTLFFSNVVIDFIRRRILLHISTRINISMLSNFFIKLMKLPMQYFDSKLLGDLLQRIDDHERIENFLTNQSLSILFAVFNVFIFGIVLWFYSFKIFFVFFVGSMIYSLWIFSFLKKRKKIDYKLFELHALNRSKTLQLLTGMQEIKLQSCEKRKRWEWEDIQAYLFQINLKSLNLDQIQASGTLLINESKNIIITILAATSVINGNITLGMMLAIQYIIAQLNSPIEQMIDFIHSFQDTQISLDRINEIHEKKIENDTSKLIPKDYNLSDLTLSNLSFQYEGPRSPYALKNINTVIKKNKVTAIVGASGSGKTTLIKLLLQFYEPSKGRILLDIDNLKNINADWWRKKCGVVLQDGFIFSESIARNIAISDDDVNTKHLIYAAQMANIHEFIQDLPLKYNTIIGQEGQSLSQGQKQRILIARAIYKNPDYLFLDEATNALDANNEKEIALNLEKIFVNKTVIIVAHRLSTVKNADTIIVLDKGLIIETGNHAELTELKGAYYELVKNQLELGN